MNLAYIVVCINLCLISISTTQETDDETTHTQETTQTQDTTQAQETSQPPEVYRVPTDNPEDLFKEDEESYETIMRKNNIMVHGLRAVGKLDTYEDKEETLVKLFRDTMGVEFHKRDIEFIREIMRDNPDSPVLVGLSTLQKKEEILMKRTALRGTRIYIDLDYSPAMVSKRRALKDIMLKLRSRFPNSRVYMRHDKLLIDGRLYTREEAMDFGEKQDII